MHDSVRTKKSGWRRLTAWASTRPGAVGAWASTRRGVFWIQMGYLFGLGVFVILYRGNWIVDPGRGFYGPLPFLVPWFGAVGAVLLSLAGVFEHRSDWDARYCFWYASRPFIG